MNERSCDRLKRPPCSARVGWRFSDTSRGFAAICAVVTAVARPTVHAQPDAVRQAQLLGTWRGTSVCTDRVAAPACRDETVVYEFTAGSEPGTVHWVADKVVEGQRERMGDLELTYDKAEGCWKAEFSSPRSRSVWRLFVKGERLSGSGQLLPGNETVRKLDLRKESKAHPPSGL